MESNSPLPSKLADEGKYRIIDVAYTSEFGVTYSAESDEGVPVLLKELAPTELVVREDGKLRIAADHLVDEFEKLKALVYEDMWRLMKVQSRHLARILSVFRTEETVYIAVEKYPGVSLRQFVEDNGPVSEPFLRVFALGLIDALEKMHQEGFVHRNIMPDKILVAPSGQPMLAPEFSALGLNMSRHDKSVSRMLSKANAYSAAEVLNEVDLQTPSSDIYSVAATLYFAITGQDPASASTRIFKMARSEADPNIKLADLDSPVSGAIRKGVDDALKVFDADRAHSISAWAKTLRLNSQTSSRPQLQERRLRAEPATKPEMEKPELPKAKTGSQWTNLILAVGAIGVAMAALYFFL